MKVVIDIPKEAFNYIKDNKKLGWIGDYELAEVIANGIPLADGDLISRDYVEYAPSAEKTTNKININEYVKVKLTDYGKEIFYHQYDNLNNKAFGKEIIKPSYPAVDSDGYTSFQLWYFMNLYGRYIDMGVQNVIEPLEIVFESAEETAECDNNHDCEHCDWTECPLEVEKETDGESK